MPRRRSWGHCRRHAGVLYFLPHWSVTPEADLKRACFCTSPAIRRPASNLLCEVIGTFVLVLVVSAIFSKAVAAGGPSAGLGPYLVGSLVWGIGLSLGGTTVMPSIRRETWGLASRTPSCRWPARADRIGLCGRSRGRAMLGALWPGCLRGWRSSSGATFGLTTQTIVCPPRCIVSERTPSTTYGLRPRPGKVRLLL